MDVLIKLATSFGFIRVNNNCSGVYVFHCVPGAGKSTLIRSILNCDSRFQAFTFGKADLQNLEGRRIKGPSEAILEGKLNIVDEYTEGNWEQFNPVAIFGDPIQSANLDRVRPCSFICRETRRFGKSTCKLLKGLGFEVNSNLEDTVLTGDIFTVEPEGLIIAFEHEVKELLRAHNCEFHEPCAIRGLTAEVVTFITASDCIAQDLSHLFYIALTRHTKKLIVLSRDATFGSTGQD
ncbi:triple gene block protein 1 [Elderberry carlavirus B]|uniref:triple gene block protein 1 n=1 Tax=Elderberry carlavirus B TaxID=1569053 RepID=UPI00054A8362|nr:triple gene block protein 1 [Elderberry carlavirus B]AIZ76620.1 triple gene block protein 1 [Elderberry carlavirus B]